MENKLMPGTWVAINPDFEMSLMYEVKPGTPLLGMIADEVELLPTVIAFTQDGKHLGSDNADLKYLTPIEAPPFARYIELLPVVLIETYPGFRDTRTAAIVDTVFGEQINPEVLSKQVVNLKKTIATTLFKSCK